jgi:hypothetical protein
MSKYLQGRKITTAQDRCERSAVEMLHLIRKLRWMGMEEEADQLQMRLRETVPVGRVITVQRETD